MEIVVSSNDLLYLGGQVGTGKKCWASILVYGAGVSLVVYDEWADEWVIVCLSLRDIVVFEY